ncbi:MAG: CoA transferase [Lentisphaerales bacterium]|nr:CoA transferase [Lentisphaerales bacterium]
MKPLENLTVLDFSQFLAGPSASMRLADLGATVIKVERPGSGDICRQLYISNLETEGESSLFHSINRNKKSLALNLKDPQDLEKVKALLGKADVMIQNFRPGVIERLGLGFEEVQKINPRLVYASVSGYGTEGPWVNKPGQDLLAQSLSGLTWLSGDADNPPTPMGLAIADHICGAHLTQGILACLVRRGISGKGGRVDVSLMESILDIQFEVLSTHLNDGGTQPQRSAKNNAHAYLGAPYGLYKTKNGYISLAMGSLPQLAELLSCAQLLEFTKPEDAFDKRDEIKAIIAKTLEGHTSEHWLSILEAADIWCSDVFTWEKLRQHEGYKVLDMEQTVYAAGGTPLKTLRCPIRIDGEIFKSERGAPAVGQHNDDILKDIFTVCSS